MSTPVYSLQESEVPLSASNLINSTFLNTSTWMWTPENHADDHSPIPPLVHRSVHPGIATATRRLPPKPPTRRRLLSRGTTTSTLELFVNGILLQAADSEHQWNFPLLFSVPIKATPLNKVVYAVRVVNDDHGGFTAAGLRAAIQIDFFYDSNISSGPITSEVIYTGGTGNWVSSHIFGNGWERPEFDEAGWEPAVNMGSTVNESEVWTKWRKMNPPTRLLSASSIPSVGLPIVPPTPDLPSSPISPTVSPSGSPAVGPGSTTGLTSGELGGILVGVIIGAGLSGALVLFLFVRRRYRQRKEF